MSGKAESHFVFNQGAFTIDDGAERTDRTDPTSRTSWSDQNAGYGDSGSDDPDDDDDDEEADDADDEEEEDDYETDDYETDYDDYEERKGYPSGMQNGGPTEPSFQGEAMRVGAQGSDQDDHTLHHDDILRAGDHIFVRERFSQRHAIVLEVPANMNYRLSEGNSIGFAIQCTVLTFYETAVVEAREKNRQRFNFRRRRNNSSRTEYRDEATESPLIEDTGGSISREIQRQNLRQFARNSKVHKVRYGVTRKQRLLSRGGTATCVMPDPIGLVFARVNFLIANPHILPPYMRLSANDECVIMWCRTGRWVTLQGASMLSILTASPAVTSVVAAGAVTQMTATVTYTYGPWLLVYSVPATVAYPLLLPMLFTYGLTSLVPLEILRRNRKKWHTLSTNLNREFWARTTAEIRTRYFAQSISGQSGGMSSFFAQDAENDEHVAMYSNVNNTNNGSDNYGDISDYEDPDAIQRRCDRMAQSLNMQQQQGGGAGANSNGRKRFWHRFKRNNSDQRNANPQMMHQQPFRDSPTRQTPDEFGTFM